MITVLSPLYNEENNVHLLIDRIVTVMDAIGQSYEILLINDCSTDNTEKRLYEVAYQNKNIKVISLCRNSGQTAAMMAGIRYARGNVIIPIDGDLQNDPEDIPLLLQKLNEGYDVVSGWRQDRKDSPLKRNLPSRIANGLISWISGVKLHDYGCSLKAYRKEVIKNVQLYGEMHRFIPIYASWQGGKVVEVPVRHYPRIHGKSKYGLNRVFKVLLDLIIVKFMEKYFTKPIYLFGGFGMLCLFVSFIVGTWTIYLKIFKHVSFILTPLPILSVMLSVSGTMSILLGLIAEILSRTYFESQNKSIYLVKNTINMEPEFQIDPV